MEKPKECYGCKGSEPDECYDRTDTSFPSLGCEMPPKFKHDNESYECPCTTCLLKMICHTACPSIHVYVATYYTHYNCDNTLMKSIWRRFNERNKKKDPHCL